MLLAGLGSRAWIGGVLPATSSVRRRNSSEIGVLVLLLGLA
jgi:hypothetical protein